MLLNFQGQEMGILHVGALLKSGGGEPVSELVDPSLGNLSTKPSYCFRTERRTQPRLPLRLDKQPRPHIDPEQQSRRTYRL